MTATATVTPTPALAPVLKPSFWTRGAEDVVKSEPLEVLVTRTVVDVVDKERRKSWQIRSSRCSHLQ